MIKAAKGYVVVEIQKEEDKSPSGLFLVREAKNESTALVVDVGPGWIDGDLNKDDLILFNNSEKQHLYENFYSIPQKDVLGVVGSY